jgi:hypothetical protein
MGRHRARITVLGLAMLPWLSVVVRAEEPRVPRVHPRASGIVQTLAESEDPGVLRWSWIQLRQCGEGALPAIQPLLEHEDPVRQLQALRLLHEYQERLVVAPQLRPPGTIRFSGARLEEGLFLAAQEAGRSLVVHDAAAMRIQGALVLTTDPWQPWEDLQGWAREQAEITPHQRHGVLVLLARKTAVPPELSVPAGLPEGTVDTGVGRGASPAWAMQEVRHPPAGAGLVVLPGTWQRRGSLSYCFTHTPWYAVIDSLRLGADLELTWVDQVLVVHTREDRLPEDVLPELPAEDRESPPRLGRFAVLAPSPLVLLGQLAARDGRFLVGSPALRAHLDGLPRARVSLPGQAAEEAHWIHARFTGYPAREALHLLAGALRLDVVTRGSQVELVPRPGVTEQEE